MKDEFDDGCGVHVSVALCEVIDRLISGLDERTRFITFSEADSMCESPIEADLLYELQCGSYGYRFRLVRTDSIDQLYKFIKSDVEVGSGIIVPQVSADRYRCDFVLGKHGVCGPELTVVECDGFEFHDRHEYQRQNDMARDAVLKNMGIRVLRFPGYRIINEPKVVVYEIIKSIGWEAVYPWRDEDLGEIVDTEDYWD